MTQIERRVFSEVRQSVPRVGQERWRTCSNISELLDTSHSSVKRIGNRYRGAHPDWFRSFATRGGSFEHYSPELVGEIISQVRARLGRESPPEGWKTLSDISRDFPKEGLVGTSRTIKKLATKLKDAHPEWARTYLHRRARKLYKYASPELVSEIRAQLQASKPPQEWITQDRLREELGVGFGSLKVFSREIQTQHPEWFRGYVDHQGTNPIYFSPQAFEAIKSRAQASKPPEDWFTNFGLAKKLLGEGLRVATQRTIRKTAVALENDHPEWFGRYLTTGGKERTMSYKLHYSPQAIAEITRILRGKRSVQAPHKPAGYWTQENIEKEAEAAIRKFGSLSGRRNNNLRSVIYSRYPGGLSALREKLGEKAFRKNPGFWTTERIENEVREFYLTYGALNGKLLSDNQRGDLKQAIAKYPGKLSALKEKIGIPQENMPPGFWTPKSIEKEAREFLLKYGSIDHRLLVSKKRKDLLSAISKKYPGGIQALKKKFGIEESRRASHYWTSEKVAQEARDFYSKHGSISYSILGESGRWDLASAIQKYFPDQMTGIKRIILGENFQGSISPDEARKELQKLVEV